MLIDFGLAVKFSPRENRMKRFAGTYRYMAPEVSQALPSVLYCTSSYVMINVEIVTSNERLIGIIAQLVYSYNFPFIW